MFCGTSCIMNSLWYAFRQIPGMAGSNARITIFGQTRVSVCCQILSKNAHILICDARHHISRHAIIIIAMVAAALANLYLSTYHMLFLFLLNERQFSYIIMTSAMCAIMGLSDVKKRPIHYVNVYCKYVVSKLYILYYILAISCSCWLGSSPASLCWSLMYM
jgi:hypothetical protein